MLVGHPQSITLISIRKNNVWKPGMPFGHCMPATAMVPWLTLNDVTELPKIAFHTHIYLIISLGGWEIPGIPEIPGISGLRARNVHGYARVRTSIYVYISKNHESG